LRQNTDHDAWRGAGILAGEPASSRLLEIGPLQHKVGEREPSEGQANISLDIPEVFL
jgi:hypothetical protein